ncbi:hypothetical protein ACKFRU_02260 [Corynebacterium tuberculostearicum]|uniref:hypothetical protein n=1 Tax=Corynebacterium tuberculostearicum TaxID=38304 RepID=UPI0038D1D9AE
MTEDQVRLQADSILGLSDKASEVKQGTGQITTFNQLGFPGVNDKPDGWYLPDNKTMPAIIAEFKSSEQDLGNDCWVQELKKNVDIVHPQYDKCIGILYNHDDIRVFINNVELDSVSTKLEHKSYYLKLATNTPIDKMRIYTLTQRINNTLHFEFGVKNLYSRMVFTACSLVALREGAWIAPGMDYSNFHNSVLNQLNKSLQKHVKRNLKLSILTEQFSAIKMNYPDNQGPDPCLVDT